MEFILNLCLIRIPFFLLQTSEYAGEVNTVNLKAGVTSRVLAVSTEGVLAETRSLTTKNGREKLFSFVTS